MLEADSVSSLLGVVRGKGPGVPLRQQLSLPLANFDAANFPFAVSI